MSEMSIVNDKSKLTKFEKIRMISARALQIAAGAPPLIETDEIDPIKIAKAEFEAGVIPLVVRRRMPEKLSV